MPRSRTGFRDFDMTHLMRAMGITMVVLNHSGFWQFHGGLNILLLVAGISLARSSLGGSRAGILRNLRAVALGIAVPSLLLAGLSALWAGRLDLLEMAMISNWFYPERISYFPIWYTQSLLQLLAALALAVWLGDLARYLHLTPVRSALALFLLALFLAALSKLLWDTAPLRDKLPHLLAWNFFAGWLIWCAVLNERAGWARRLGASVLILGACYLMFVELALQQGEIRILWVPLAVLALIWIRALPLPFILRHPLLLLSRAALYVFLLHYPVIHAMEKLRIESGWADGPLFHLSRFALAILLPVIVWALVSATVRSWKRTAPRPFVERGAGGVRS